MPEYPADGAVGDLNNRLIVIVCSIIGYWQFCEQAFLQIFGMRAQRLTAARAAGIVRQGYTWLEAGNGVSVRLAVSNYSSSAARDDRRLRVIKGNENILP